MYKIFGPNFFGRDDHIAVKRKFADDYVGRPKIVYVRLIHIRELIKLYSAQS